jgi:CPA2 family monovalent cation:H+ antiporter-2
VHHEASLILTIGWGLVIAFACGFITSRIKLSPLLGYLLAGVLIGPYTPGFVGDRAVAEQAAELGVVLLMFGVGLHFSPREFAAVRWIAAAGALGQATIVTGVTTVLGLLLGMALPASIILGLALAIASTFVALRELDRAHATGAPVGQINIGWLVVEDIVMVIVLVAIPVLAPVLQNDGSLAMGALAEQIGVTVLGVIVFVGAMLVVGRRAVPWFLAQVAATGSRELFTLATLSVALGIALAAAQLFGVSVALGAFLAGVVLSESDLSHQAAADALPLRDAFAVLFFVSVGMLFDPEVVLREPLAIVLALGIVLVLKPLVSAAIVAAFRYSARTALQTGGYRAQIGEFSFVLVGVAASVGLADRRVSDIVIAVALVSIALAPVSTRAARLLELGLLRFPQVRPLILRRRGLRDRRLATATDTQNISGHVVLVGHGRSGSVVAQALAVARVPFVIIEQDRGIVEALREGDLPVVFGNAAREQVLRAAGITRAKLVIVTSPDPQDARLVLAAARGANPEIDSVIRVHSMLLKPQLLKAGAGAVVVAEHELAYTVCEMALERLGITPEKVTETVRKLRAMDKG